MALYALKPLISQGGKVYTNYDVVGYTTDQEGKLQLLFTVVSFNSGGVPLYSPYKDELRQAVSKPDEPINSYFNFDLPLYVPAGKFSIHIKVHDSVKNTDSELIQSFAVEAAPIVPSTNFC